ncbi:MAG: Asp-tRNA(Asn)/Glu-tRNA(Gln) amidotransferase subunit GatC [Deltaproteobacteria bacterium]|nr:Asp-tRNA(Asn)/Glu-tRNA(Gln) amidotransferase subunit GatC [Deltaproteobacteria bacterium]
MATITLEEVQEIAFLARLRLGDEEVKRLQGDLRSILEYIDKLRRLDTRGVEPMTHAVPMDCPLREDEVKPSLAAEEAMMGAPRRQDGFFEVPRIIDVHAASEERKP